ncbi:MAG: beta strand repeat-containing protein, partial [Akkermansiaceae bacterium]
THSRTTLACAAALSLLAPASIHAATETWDGGHGSANAWFANLNWADDTAPVDFDDLVFTGTTRLDHFSYGNFSGTGDAKINSITFDAAAGAFIIRNGGGGTHIMLGDITNNSTNLQTILFPFQLNADVAVNAASGAITIGGVISEDGSARSLIKSGSNIVSLTGANTYTGTTDINQGRLQLGDGGTTGSLSTSSAIDIASGAAFMANHADGHTVTQGTDFSSAAITGAGYIANDGDGTLVLDRANSHTGGVRIGRDNLGDESATRVIQVTDSGALGTGTLGFYKSGTLELGADALTIANNVFSGNYSAGGNYKIIKLDLAGTNSGTMSGNIDTRGGTFEGFQTDVGADDTLTLSGNIYNGAGGGSGITKVGDGTLILSGTNTYNGETRVKAGTLKLSGGSAIEDERNVFVDTNGTLDLNDSNETIHKLTGSGTVDNTAAGTATLIVGSSGGNATFDGTITDTGAALKFRKIGSGTQTLTAASSYQGGTDIYEGTIVASHSSALGTGQVYMGVTNGVTQTLAIGADGVNIANSFFMQNSGSDHEIKLDLTGTNSATLSGNMTNQITSVGRWDFIVGADDTLTVSGVLKNGSAGGSGIDKDGAGTLVLSGANTYKGATRVNEGTLSLATGYSHSGTGAYTVQGGTLKIADGVDISTHAMTINSGGVISPGNSPGTAITGSQTWNDGGAYLWEVNDSGGTKGDDPGWDWLDITGTLELGSLSAGGFTIDIDSLTASNVVGDAVGFDTFTQMDGIFDYSFVIATASGGINDFDASLFTLDSSGFSNAPSWDWQIVLSGNDLVLEAYAVPEPSSTALLGLGGLALALRRKRS